MKKRAAMALLIIFLGTGICLAAEGGAAAGTGAHAQDLAPHPAIPDHPTWVRPLAILILGMFAVAIPVGMFIRATMPEEVPPTHAHDEHHGHKDPEHDHGLGGHDSHGHGGHGHGH